MAFVTNAGALAARKRILAGNIEARFRTAAKLHATEMKRVAENLSHGSLTKKDLRDKGNPYATRLPAGSAGFPDYLINIGGGDFANSWRTRVQQSGNRWTVSIWNDSQHAKFMVGTVRERKRDIMRVVVLKTTKSFHDAVDKEIKRGIAENNRSSAPVSGSTGSFGAMGEGSASVGGYSAFSAVSIGVTAGLFAAAGAVYDGVSEN
ncbi:hypothetical protein CCAX7_54560 [Capsulimonas corticalis]|uniref:Uncharacterized protein n=1 Tax=Capsulimonas corticalis TaxID=2219043 RepID=A0A402D5S4_9BACT|nr:hypothetical protein [Capsulimonas corticalis]BDI33405.1 hypothetical protein CCAX7_54560 [Capsulimonas corticalis]